MNKRLLIGIGVVLLGCGVIYLSNQYSSDPSETTYSPVEEYNVTDKTLGNVSEEISHADAKNYSSCLTILNQQNQQKSNWARNSYTSWDGYVEEGTYSLNEVTLVVEHFLNSNFAESFRIEYIRSDAPTSVQTKGLNDKFFDLEPLAKEWGLSVMIKVPNPKLKNFEHLTLLEKQTTLAENNVSVDDVAYFLLDKNTSDDSILMMFEALENPFAKVSYDRYATTSLLDYAIVGHRDNIVNAMLKRGFRPTQDEYLGSSMEWALSALTYSFHDDNRASAANIVLKLLDFNAAARFESQTYELVEGRFPRQSFRFDDSEIQTLIIDYNLDLTSIAQRKNIRISENHPLIETLEKQQLASVQGSLNQTELNRIIKECNAHVTELNKRWQPQEIHDVVSEVASRFDGDKKAIIRELSDTDPVLVDYYLRKYRAPNKGVSVNQALLDKIDSSYTYFRKGKAQQGIDLILSEPVHKSQYEFVMYKLLMFQTGYSAIIQSPFWSGINDYNELTFRRLLNSDFIENMSVLGVPIYEPDAYGKSLVYYAASKHDAELISYLFENNVQFSGSNEGQDPLHIALNIRKNTNSLMSIEKTVNELMRFKPTIDKFHKSRMKLVKLYYPESYARLTALHPELRVNEDEAISLPETYLYTYF